MRTLHLMLMYLVFKAIWSWKSTFVYSRNFSGTSETTSSRECPRDHSVLRAQLSGEGLKIVLIRSEGPRELTRQGMPHSNSLWMDEKQKDVRVMN
ncbi:hypothetical protein CEXT_89121 [Caerostris extrusa]|uniref:Secreted protein n=1 Tax=Caerostris extrusa TaxID=172846 RepID=A0AAV4SWM6_CAEEX|nr:hypothetical protein CEXT_89121 [Caerostris extrusa]